MLGKAINEQDPLAYHTMIPTVTREEGRFIPVWYLDILHGISISKHSVRAKMRKYLKWLTPL